MDFVVGDSDTARIIVAERGDGVPPQALSHIFEPIYRVTEASEHQNRRDRFGLVNCATHRDRSWWQHSCPESRR